MSIADAPCRRPALSQLWSIERAGHCPVPLRTGSRSERLIVLRLPPAIAQPLSSLYNTHNLLLCVEKGKKGENKGGVFGPGANWGLGARGKGPGGATIIVTARTRRSGTGQWPGSLDETIAEIEQAGGKGIGIECDHSNDKAVEELFARLARDHGVSTCL